MEKAVKVARLTNGMHVYRWSIVSKVASFGWNRKRPVKRRRFQSGSSHQPATKSMEFEMKEGLVEKHTKKDQSYAEEFEKEGFINNRFFWDDHFVSMSKWSNNPSPNLRIVWIGCSGIPLNFWSFDFFEKLGWMVEETLLVDEETSLRRRLDKERVLVLVRKEETISVNVRVDMGNGSFTVAIKEEAIQRAFVWAHFKKGLDYQLNLRETSDQSQKERSSDDKLVSVVQETRDSSEARKSEQEQEQELTSSNFSSTFTTRKMGKTIDEPGFELVTKKVRDVDEEVLKAMEIGDKLGLDFVGKEAEMADIIRRRELEDTDQCGQGKGW
ncbi:hypothetical protein LWI28_008684 [Acer negundo]|uniref:DUF4283 domain-containing protein n=1 Tax=Acer negundo TaxID=4023 RepID=A0AAD5J5D7_ACENE|nr:hypothetical protein LWI28_008684 [Acer negundo]